MLFFSIFRRRRRRKEKGGKIGTDRDEKASDFRQCQGDTSVGFCRCGVGCYFHVEIIVEMPVTGLVRVPVFFFLINIYDEEIEARHNSLYIRLSREGIELLWRSTTSSTTSTENGTY